MRNLKKIILVSLVLMFGTAAVLIYMTISNSKDCSQLVIDTYEIHSNIDIPDVTFVNCYYDKNSNVRISVYDLVSNINLDKFKQIDSSIEPDFLLGKSLLSKSEQPSGSTLYLASGNKWGTAWTYLVDIKSKRLWAELRYRKNA